MEAGPSILIFDLYSNKSYYMYDSRILSLDIQLVSVSCGNIYCFLLNLNLLVVRVGLEPTTAR